MNNLVFNTIATLIQLSMALLGSENVEEIKDNEDVVALVNEFLLLNDKNDDVSQRHRSIIDACEERKDYYFVRAMICRLELTIDLAEIIQAYDFNTMQVSSKIEKSFLGLNSNIDETGIIILPKIKSLKALSKHANADGEYLPKKNANDWLEDINTRLNRIYYIKTSELSGYTIRNYLFSSPVEQEENKEYIRIGMSPIVKKRLSELFDIDYHYGTTADGLHPTQLFGIRDLLCKELISRKTQLAFERACFEKCDIFISPEMLGTDELLLTDDGISDLFRPKRSNMFQTPFLTLPPTQWENRQNTLSIFDKNGEKIGEQHKQKRFKFKHDGSDWYEDLQNPKKEILLIHIDKWGRFAFPICMDFLTSSYRDILTQQLKATFLLCPSFSSGEYNFDLSAGNDSEFEVRTVWINSCSAYEHGNANHVGEVSVPTCLDRSRRTKIESTCGGECKDICLFLVDIPKDCNDENKKVDVKHICESS